MRALPTLLLCAAAQAAVAQELTAPADTTESTKTLDAVRVTAPRLRMEDIYRSKPPPRTEPTIFDKYWRESLSLYQLGMNGGLLGGTPDFDRKENILAPRKIPASSRSASSSPTAVIRSVPLDEAQMQRAMQLQQAAGPAD